MKKDKDFGLETLGKEIPAPKSFARSGLRKIYGERVPSLMSHVSGIKEADIIKAAIELKMVMIDDDNRIVPTNDDPSFDVREERNLYFNEAGQKKIYDYMGMSDWYKDDVDIKKIQ